MTPISVQADQFLSPKDTTFQLTGNITLNNNGDPLTCKLTLSGETSDGVDKQYAGYITGAVAMGDGCKHVTFPSLPWYMNLNGGEVFIGISYTTKNATCQSFPYPRISSKGIWSLVDENACGLTGSAKSTPPITLDKNRER
jgi:hypothetical protein